MLATAIMLWCALRGLVEGQVMVRYTDQMADPEAQDDMDGVRCHRWFQWYHQLCLARDGALVAVILAAYHFGNITTLINVGALFLGWELFEAIYNYTRYGKFFTSHENVLGTFSLDNASDVWLLHSTRFLCGAGLILWGLS